MFDFFKRKRRHRSARPPAIPLYRTEFERRKDALYEKFAVEDTPYDQLLDAMSAVDHEMNHVGGGNWNDGGYDEYLAIIRCHLTSDPQFSPEQLRRIGNSLADIAACGEELARDGQSSASLEEQIDYLIARVVDWCRTHEPEPGDDT